jgi:hypothetical protein
MVGEECYISRTHLKLTQISLTWYSKLKNTVSSNAINSDDVELKTQINSIPE